MAARFTTEHPGVLGAIWAEFTADVMAEHIEMREIYKICTCVEQVRRHCLVSEPTLLIERADPAY